MTPLPENPKVVILIDNDGNLKIATNVSSDLVVEVTKSQREFGTLKAGLPFQEVKPS